MAGEVLGRTYEAMVRLVLRKIGIPDNQIFWDQQPEWMSIKADFVIGKEIEKPRTVILCAHSTSSSDSHKKFWRNLEELFETKAVLPQSLNTYNVLFNRSYKQALLTIMDAVFDGQLIIPDRPYGKVLLEKGIGYSKGAFKEIGAENMLAALEKACDTESMDYDKDLAKSLDAFSKELKKVLKQTSSKFKVLWSVIREHYLRDVDVKKAQPTYVKRGIGKLTLFTPDERKAIYEHIATGNELTEIPSFASYLDYFNDTISGFVLADREILDAVAYLNPKQIEAVIAESPLDRMDLFIQPVRHIVNLKLFHSFIVDHYDELTTQKGMLKYLEQCFNDPMSLLPESKVSGEIDKVWLVESLFSLFKALENKQQGYGYSKLEQCMEIDDPGSIRFWGPSFAARQKKPMADEFKELSRCLSEKLKKYNEEKISDFLNLSISMELNTNIEAKLLPYRSFDPIGCLIIDAFEKAGIRYEIIKSHSSVLSEFAEVNAATTKVLITNQNPPTLVKWQSAYDKGKGHKRKELAARGTSLKFRWEQENRKFYVRPYGAFVLVLDGTWDNDDLFVLQRAGWDYMFYPHEMDQLVQLIQSFEKSGPEKELIVPDEPLPLAAEEDKPIRLKK